MEDLKTARDLLDQINAAIASYDPVLKETARDILIEHAFGRARPRARAAGEPEAAEPAAPRRRGRPAGSRRGGMQISALLEQWTPETMAERALLGAYSLARGKADRTVTSQSVNAELKRNDIPVPNITRAIESNLRAKPPLMVQKKKMGTTRQARKQYAITEEGVAFVEERLNGAGAAAAGGGEPGEE